MLSLGELKLLHCKKGAYLHHASDAQLALHLHSNDRQAAPPTSFEIPLEEELSVGDGEDSLIKKHPPLPKRLEERLTKQLSPPPTISDLCDKLASAELRRNSVSEWQGYCAGERKWVQLIEIGFILL